MRWKLGKKFSPIGVDLGARTLKAAQLLYGGASRQLHAGVVLPLPAPNHPLDQQTAKYLRDVLFRHGFVGDDIVLAAPNKQLEIDVLELPPRSSGAPIEQIAQMELSRTAKLENDVFEMDCWELPSTARGTSAGTSMMAVALRHKDADALIEPFEAERMNVIAVDARCLAMARAAAPYYAADAVTAILDIGWNHSLIVLVCNGAVVYQRTLDNTGIASLFELISEEFQLGEEEIDYLLRNIGRDGKTDEPSRHLIEPSRRIEQIISRNLDAMTSEIDTAFQYARHRYPVFPIKKLVLLGGGSLVMGTSAWLRNRLGIDVMELMPQQIVQCPENLRNRGNNALLTTAIGLAMHGTN